MSQQAKNPLMIFTDTVMLLTNNAFPKFVFFKTENFLILLLNRIIKIHHQDSISTYKRINLRTIYM